MTSGYAKQSSLFLAFHPPLVHSWFICLRVCASTTALDTVFVRVIAIVVLALSLLHTSQFPPCSLLHEQSLHLELPASIFQLHVALQPCSKLLEESPSVFLERSSENAREIEQ
jgi:hypothetical protein